MQDKTVQSYYIVTYTRGDTSLLAAVYTSYTWPLWSCIHCIMHVRLSDQAHVHSMSRSTRQCTHTCLHIAYKYGWVLYAIIQSSIYIYIQSAWIWGWVIVEQSHSSRNRLKCKTFRPRKSLTVTMLTIVYNCWTVGLHQLQYSTYIYVTVEDLRIRNVLHFNLQFSLLCDCSTIVQSDLYML